MNPTQLFNLDYLFDPTPGDTFYYMVFFIILFLALILGSFYLESWIRKHPLRSALQSTLPHIGFHLRIFGMMGFVFLFVRYENMPYFSMRFLFVLYLLWIAVYVGMSLYRFKTTLPETIEEQHRLKKRAKYLPKKKTTKKKKR